MINSELILMAMTDPNTYNIVYNNYGEPVPMIYESSFRPWYTKKAIYNCIKKFDAELVKGLTRPTKYNENNDHQICDELAGVFLHNKPLTEYLIENINSI